jgi:hypothetical protein
VAAILLLLSAFEFPGYAGRSAAMLAGAAVVDGNHAFFLNPALGVGRERCLAGVCYSRPFGLPGLSWGRALGVWSSGRLAAGVGFAALGLEHYAEQDAEAVFAGSPLPAVAVGLAVHALIVRAVQEQGDVAPSLDAGACWRSGRLQVGAAGLRVNAPCWREGSELPTRIVLGGSWSPVDDLLLALDVSREGGDEDAAFGAEFRLVPQLGLRMGIGAAPFRYAAGIGAVVGPLGFDYAYQFHPQLKETHVLGLHAAWR